MLEQINLGEISVDIIKKNIKNIHLSVYPPTGRVRISAPLRLDLDAIRVFAASKLDWIKKQRRKLKAQDRETPRDYIDGESHFIWGKRYLLKVIKHETSPRVELQHNKVVLHVRVGTNKTKKKAVIESWYRDLLKEAIPSLISKWEPLMGVKVEKYFVQKMKTKWGSCNPRARNIRLNTDLAKKPKEFLEYIVVHEMVHLLEPSHNTRFKSFMDAFMPKWRFYKDELNRLPVRSEVWTDIGSA